MLSNLPKLADRTFVIGCFLPALLFAVVLLRLFGDVAICNAIWKGLKEKEAGDAIFFLLAVWTGGVMLSTVNHEIYRTLEGYRWPVSALKGRQDRRREELVKKQKEVSELRELWKVQGNAFSPWMSERYGDLREELLAHYPEQAGHVLPTRFGNAIRSFESYPRMIYGADGVAVWPRLYAVIPKAVAEQIADARSQVDFFMNCCVLAVVVCLLAAGRLLCDVPWSQADGTTAGNLALLSGLSMRWLLWSAAAALVAAAAYNLAVARVQGWGNQVRSAFDLYLPALAAALGFELPPTHAARHQFWVDFSQMILFGPETDGGVRFHTRYRAK
jgi:hypothetical protein